MKSTLLYPASILAMSALLSTAQAQSQFPEEFSDDLLPGLQSNVVRAQLIPLRKGAFSAGISAIVKQINVQEGEAVKKGDVLLSFDCDAIEATRSTAAARVKSAEAKLEVSRELLKLNSVGPLEVTLNEAELGVARGELDAVLSQLKHCRIEAPFAGVITARGVEPHQFVEVGAPLLELVSSDELEVRMLMPSTSLSWLRAGSDFRMLVEELDKPMLGKISRIGGAVDPVSLTVPVFGKLQEADKRLLPGMSGRVQFIDSEFD